MRVLVTGATGFVGPWVCATLARAGMAVRGAVRHGDGPRKLSNGFVLADCVAVGAISDTTDWSAALHGVDAVVHLAARVHIMRDDAADPLQAFCAVNVDATLRLAREAAARGVTRFVFVSSVKVHGEQTELRPFTEDDAPHPGDPYAQSKWKAEQALHDLAEATSLSVVVVRPPLVYGPGVRANFLALLRLVDRNIPLPFASIANARSMIGVRNLADVLVACVTDPRASGQTFLVHDAEAVSTPELIRRMAAALGRRPRLFPFPPAVLVGIGRIMGWHAAIRRLTTSLIVDDAHVRATLGWTPPVTMEEEFRATVSWYRTTV